MFDPALLNQLSEGVIVAGPDGKLSFVNDAAARLHGVKALDVAPDDYSETYHLFTEDGEPYPFDQLPLARAVLHGETVEEARWRIRRPDGSEILAIGSARPLFVGEDRAGAILTLRDDTARHSAELALRASEERMRLVLETAPGAFYSVDREGNTALVSRGFLAMMGFASEADVIGVKLHGVIHHTRADGSPHLVEQCPIYRCAAAGAPAHVPDDIFIRRDGSPVPVEYWVSPIMRGEEHIGAACTILDLTERKAAEQAMIRLNETLEQRVLEIAAERERSWQLSQELLAVATADGIFLEVNVAWTALLGWEAHELLGQSISDFIHPDDKAATEAKYVAIFDSPLTDPYEYRFRGKDGGYRWFSWTAVYEHGRVYASGRDVNAEKERQAELESAQEALRQSQKMDAIGQLTGGIAHDFNNLLQIISGNLDILSRSITDESPRLRRSIDNAAKGAERAAILTQRLLAFSRRQPLAPKIIDPNKLVSGMSDMLHRTLGETYEVETVTGSGLWRVEADPNQLESALLNLAINARDAMPMGGKLTVETANAHLDRDYAKRHSGVSPGQYAVICVTDTGSGMDPDTAERAVEPFFTTKDVGKGTGLGLSMVYGFVKQSGGHLKIYSEPGEGTTVKIYLPRHQGPEQATEAEAQSDAPAGVDGETILICEDDEDVRAYSAEVLRELGYRVIEAADGETTLRLLASENGRVDLLFTDIVLPGGMTGAVVAERARAAQPGLKVLFTTGYARNAIVHHGRLDPGVELLSKPFAYADLAARIRDLLDAP